MRAKYSIPKISKTTHLWYVHFRYEGKQYRYKLHYNQIKDLKERQKEFDSFCWELKEKLKNGWYPNKVEKKKKFVF